MSRIAHLMVRDAAVALSRCDPDELVAVTLSIECTAGKARRILEAMRLEDDEVAMALILLQRMVL